MKTTITNDLCEKVTRFWGSTDLIAMDFLSADFEIVNSGRVENGDSVYDKPAADLWAQAHRQIGVPVATLKAAAKAVLLFLKENPSSFEDILQWEWSDRPFPNVI